MYIQTFIISNKVMHACMYETQVLRVGAIVHIGIGLCLEHKIYDCVSAGFSRVKRDALSKLSTGQAG